MKSHSDTGDYFALGQGRKVDLLCEDRGPSPGTGRLFWVVNGAWEGVYYPITGTLQIDRTGEHRPTTLLWKGHEPPGRDYNEQIAWVQEQVQRPLVSRWEMILAWLKDLRNVRLVIRLERRRAPKQEDWDDEIPF